MKFHVEGYCHGLLFPVTPKNQHMTISDVQLIGKKIAVGIVVATVPLVILLGGLWLIQKILTNQPASQVSSLNLK